MTALVAPPELLSLVDPRLRKAVPVHLLAAASALHQVILGALLAKPISRDVLMHGRCSCDSCDHPACFARLRLLRSVRVAVPDGHVLDVVLSVL